MDSLVITESRIGIQVLKFFGYLKNHHQFAYSFKKSNFPKTKPIQPKVQKKPNTGVYFFFYFMLCRARIVGQSWKHVQINQTPSGGKKKKKTPTLRTPRRPRERDLLMYGRITDRSALPHMSVAHQPVTSLTSSLDAGGAPSPLAGSGGAPSSSSRPGASPSSTFSSFPAFAGVECRGDRSSGTRLDHAVLAGN